MRRDPLPARLDVRVPDPRHRAPSPPPRPLPTWLDEVREGLDSTGRYVAYEEDGEPVIVDSRRLDSNRPQQARRHLSLDDATVSRRHALIVRTPEDELRALDDRSLNGLFVNGERSSGPRSPTGTSSRSAATGCTCSEPDFERSRAGFSTTPTSRLRVARGVGVNECNLRPQLKRKPRSSTRPHRLPSPEDALEEALERGRRHLMALQDSAGWWKAELETNVTMDAEDLLLREFLGIGDAAAIGARGELDPLPAARGRHAGPTSTGPRRPLHDRGGVRRAQARRATQPMRAHMAPRAVVLAAGGIESARVFTHIWLALFGLWEWDDVPALPPS